MSPTPPLGLGPFTSSPDGDRNPNRDYTTSTTASTAPSPAGQVSSQPTTATSSSPGRPTRTLAGPLTTVFRAPDSCAYRDYAILPPSLTPQQHVFAVYQGGRCHENNDCLPWHDRAVNQGFFSPAFYCPNGWSGQFTMASGRYYADVWQSAASEMASTPRMFPMETLLPAETAVVCCPPCVPSFPDSL